MLLGFVRDYRTGGGCSHLIEDLGVLAVLDPGYFGAKLLLGLRHKIHAPFPGARWVGQPA